MARQEPSIRPTEEERLTELVRRTEGLQPWRRVLHALSGVALAEAVVLLPPGRGPVLLVLGGALLVLAAGDLARLARPRLNALFFRAFPSLASPREARRPASSTWYVLGVFLALALFSRERAVAGILVLALADPTASLVGRRWGRTRLGHGSVEGSLALFAVAFAVLVPLVGPVQALVAAAVATAVEPIPWALDDNLTLPVTVAATLWILTAALPR